MFYSQHPPQQSSDLFDEAARIDFVRAYLTSGLSKNTFCLQQGLKASTFKNWFYRYRDVISSDPLSSQCDPEEQPSHTPLFSPIKVIPDEGVVTDEAHDALPPSLQIEIHAFRLCVPTGADKQTLQTILSILKNLS